MSTKEEKEAEDMLKIVLAGVFQAAQVVKAWGTPAQACDLAEQMLVEIKRRGWKIPE